MRNGNKAPKLSLESVPQAGDGLAINWLQENLVGGQSLGQRNGNLPRWGRTYPDGSRLKLFLDPDKTLSRSVITAGHRAAICFLAVAKRDSTASPLPPALSTSFCRTGIALAT